MPRQSMLALFIRLFRMLSRQIIYPSPVRIYLLTFAQLRSQVEPRKSIANSADFVADGFCGVLAHALVEVFIGEKVVEMLGHGIAVTRLHNKAVLFVLDL